MKIQVLGTGCPKCKKLAEAVELAIKELGLDYDIEKITNINQIMAFGVMITPALVVNGKVVSSGKIPTTDAIKEFLK